MKLQTVRATYKDGKLVFADPHRMPEDGDEVVVTFVEKPGDHVPTEMDPIQALKGRARGEGLLERLLQSRREDRERDEQHTARLRS